MNKVTLLTLALGVLLASLGTPASAQGTVIGGKKASQRVADRPTPPIHDGSTGPTKPDPKDILGKGKVAQAEPDQSLWRYFEITTARADKDELKDTPEGKRLYRGRDPEDWDERPERVKKPRHNPEDCDCPCHRQHYQPWKDRDIEPYGPRIKERESLWRGLC